MRRAIPIVAAGLAAFGALDARGASIPQCRTSQLTLRAGREDAGLGHAGSVLVLANRSSQTCRTGGFLGVQRLDAHLRPVRTVPHHGSGYLFRSPSPKTIVVAPGDSVSAGVEWLNSYVEGESKACVGAGHFLRVTPPNETHPLTVKLRTSSCKHGSISTTALQAGTFGPR